jgi:flavin-dependent dehydrogenase
MVVAYMTDADMYARGLRQNDRFWWQELDRTHHTQARLAGSDISSLSLRVISANSSHLAQTTNGGWLAVGDAAIAFDPLSGQGIYRALQSGIRAASAIGEHLAGNASALAAYDDALKRDYAQYLQLRHVFYRAEQRWPDSVFWQRRLSGAEGEIQKYSALSGILT